MLILLRYPSTRLVYITSLPIAEYVLEYYFSLLPPSVKLHRANLLMLSTEDSSPISLSKKVKDHLYRGKAQMQACVQNVCSPHAPAVLFDSSCCGAHDCCSGFNRLCAPMPSWLCSEAHLSSRRLQTTCTSRSTPSSRT